MYIAQMYIDARLHVLEDESINEIFKNNIFKTIFFNPSNILRSFCRERYIHLHQDYVQSSILINAFSLQYILRNLIIYL